MLSRSVSISSLKRSVKAGSTWDTAMGPAPSRYFKRNDPDLTAQSCIELKKNNASWPKWLFK